MARPRNGRIVSPPSTPGRHRRQATAIAAVLLMIGGCGDRPRSGASGSAATAANSTAMSPDNQLDPPALAGLSKATVAEGVPVLCYHYFRGVIAPGYVLRVLGTVVLGLPALGPREFWTTPVGEFERHLRHFRDSGTAVVTLDEVADLIAAGSPLPAKAVILTIDDADQSVYRHAFPLLKKYGLRAHLFVPTAEIGRSWSGLRLCDAGQLREMAASGLVLIDSHTHDLHYKLPSAGGPVPAFLKPEGIPHNRRLATDDPRAGRWAPIVADLQTSRDQIGRLIGPRSPWLAWPYGFASPTLDSLSLALGFRGTVSLSPRAFGPANRDLRVGRYTLTAHTTMAQITALVP